MNFFRVLFVILISLPVFAQDEPLISFKELMLNAETDYSNVMLAREITGQRNIPHSIYLPEGVFIEAQGVENGEVVYAIFNNLAKPFNNGETAFFNEIESRFDLSSARFHFTKGETQNPKLGISTNLGVNSNSDQLAVSLLMVPESTNDAVMAFDPMTGDLIDANFIPPDPTNLSTPIEAGLTPAPTILVSDQLDAAVQMYDTSGAFIITFFGGNTSILDNIRGIAFTPGYASLCVTVGSGANADAVAEFDPFGNYIGNFIAIGSGGLASPFDIEFRAADCLVAGINSDAVHQFDLSGNPIAVFAPVDNFPEQVTEFPNGNVGVADFSGAQTGVIIFDATGTQLNLFTGVSGNRGVYQLGNGNILTTNGAGVHELDGTTGALLRTVVSGVSARFISEYDLSIVPVELTAFTASVVSNAVVLSWSTATETNNSGFDIERSEDNINFARIGFVPGSGTTSETRSYSYTDDLVSGGTYYYRLKQIDYDGSFTYSDVVEVDIGLPIRFTLEQNYPNPFNPSTTIRFAIPVDAKVAVKVYNLVGEKVSEVVNNNYSAGVHMVVFDASDLTSGIYFYRIDAVGIDGSNYSDIKKMTLLK